MKNLLLLLFFTCPVFLKAQETSDLETLGRKLEKAAADTDVRTLDNLFDLDSFLDLVIIEGQNEALRGFNDGFTESAREQFSFGNLIIQNVLTVDGNLSFLRAYYKDSEPHIIFRIAGSDGINYHEYKLHEKGGTLKIKDIYIALSGEYLSETFRTVYLMAGPPAISSSLPEDQKLNLRAMNLIKTIKAHFDAGNYERSLKLFNQLDVEVRKVKAMSLLELRIKAEMGDEQYLEALGRYQKNFPDDPSSMLHAIDYLILQERFPEALKSVEKLDELVQGDSYLDIFRGNLHFMMGKSELAKPYLLSFTKNFPDDPDGWNSMLSIYSALSENDEAIDVLELLMENFLVSKSDLISAVEEDPIYASLASSKEFKTWKAK